MGWGALAQCGWHVGWILYILLWCVGGGQGEAGGCPHPPVPAAATYTNLTGGAGQPLWTVRYICDTGYELFGNEEGSCEDGTWNQDLPHCAVNVARYKPATSSSVAGGGKPENAVDGVHTVVHEGRKCTETQKEKGPWWTVDLLAAQVVKHVRITTRCCDDLPVKNLEIRVGNSKVHKDNAMCNWVPGLLKEGETRTIECVSDDMSGRYVSLSMTGANTILSLCEVEVFSPSVLGTASCASQVEGEELAIYKDSCYWFVTKKGTDKNDLGFVEAAKTCTDVGYFLADDIDEATGAFMRARLEAEGRIRKSGMVWIGATREADSEDAWRWVSGSLVKVESIFWGRQQPNNYNNEQNCAVLDSDLDWRWNDISCRVDAQTVCRGRPSRCPSPAVASGTWYTGSRDVEDAGIQYHCPTGHKPMGQENQTCSGQGAWTGEPIGCKFVDCGDVPGLRDGAIHVTDGRTTWGARIKYQCNKDYSLMNGDERRRCEEGGWTGRPPQCVYTRCPEPEQVDNADMKQVAGSQGESRLGAKVIYACRAGHVARGSLSRECELGGVWSGTRPTCEFVDCGEPPQLLNGATEMVSGRTTFNAKVQYSCDDDYRMVGDATRRCEANGRWSRARIECKIIKCGAPRAPNGGRVSGYNYEVHRKVEYSCMPGHRLDGDPVLQCLRTGKWNKSPPRCTYVDCNKLPNIKGGKVLLVNATTHLGSLARYKCDKSHKLSGPKERLCLDTGKWSGAGEALCTEIRCPLPPRPNNTVVSISSTERLHGTSVIRSKLDMGVTYKVGSQLKYRCERGHLLNSAQRVSTRRCTTLGKWTGQAPSCEYVDCGRPGAVTNGKFALQNNGTTYYGSMAFYTCQFGWKLEGFERRTCQSSGRWVPEAPVCKETLCPILDRPDNAIMNLTTLRIGGVATFSCHHGYVLNGDNDLECLSSGSWSGWPPSCSEVNCGDPNSVENGKSFLANNGSTKYGSVVEYFCVPGYTRGGPFTRICQITGTWAGFDPVCKIPKVVPPPPNSVEGMFIDNTVDGTHNINPDQGKVSQTSGIGVWIGVALGLIVVIGLMIVGIYFYKKQQSLATKPSRDNNANGLGALSPTTAYNSNGVYSTSQIGARPPPPIQMYAMDDSPEDHRGPIYDTINDDGSSHSTTYSRGSDGYPRSTAPPQDGYPRSSAPPQDGYPRSTFSPGNQGVNGAYDNAYDVPEGSERTGSRGTVTINGIAV